MTTASDKDDENPKNDFTCFEHLEKDEARNKTLPCPVNIIVTELEPIITL